MTTLSAEERAAALGGKWIVEDYEHEEFRLDVAEQIRQAEQAARADERRKVIELIGSEFGDHPSLERDRITARLLIEAIRALAKDDSEAAWQR